MRQAAGLVLLVVSVAAGWALGELYYRLGGRRPW